MWAWDGQGQGVAGGAGRAYGTERNAGRAYGTGRTEHGTRRETHGREGTRRGGLGWVPRAGREERGRNAITQDWKEEGPTQTLHTTKQRPFSLPPSPSPDLPTRLCSVKSSLLSLEKKNVIISRPINKVIKANQQSDKSTLTISQLHSVDPTGPRGPP